MASKQFDHLQESSLQRLKALVPAGCPLVITRLPHGGFHACTLDLKDEMRGRFQVVASWVGGYVACWQRVRPPVDAVSRQRL
jgi:hypothetical protein